MVRVVEKPARPPSPLLLVVEDHLDHAEALAMMLEEDGFRVELAPSGEEALAALGRGVEPQAVLLDLTLPGMDGRSLLMRLRANLPSVPVVVMSGLAPDHVAGAQASFAKPLDYEALRAKLAELTRLKS